MMTISECNGTPAQWLSIQKIPCFGNIKLVLLLIVQVALPTLGCVSSQLLQNKYVFFIHFNLTNIFVLLLILLK